MSKNVIFIVCSFILFSACARNTTVPVNLQCDNSIKRATTLLASHKEQMNKAQINRINNLIKAAKIQQQHEQYAVCNDNAHRAIDLMEPDRKEINEKMK